MKDLKQDIGVIKYQEKDTYYTVAIYWKKTREYIKKLQEILRLAY